MKRIFFNLNGQKCNIHGEIPSKILVYLHSVSQLIQNDGFVRMDWDFEDLYISIRHLRVNTKFEYEMQLTDKITKRI